MFTLIENGQVYTPEARGAVSVLLCNDKIIKIGDIDRANVHSMASTLGVELQVIDATGCVVVPGFVDPHEHLSGAGGEQGFATRLPEVRLEQIVLAGITTVVGLLGTDTVTREPSCLFAKVHQLRDEGVNAYMYTGGFELPVRTLTRSVIDDLVHIDCIIGTGEVAISDSRWIKPPLQELAFVVAQTALGGKMAGKAGVTHFHTGELPEKLDIIRRLLDEYPIQPSSIYITHITRSEALMQDAIALAERGVYVDMDAVEPVIADCIRYYLDNGGDPKQLTISSDAHTPGGSPAKFYSEFVKVAQNSGLPLETILPFFSTNAADVLKLNRKGRIDAGCDGDITILREESFELVHVFAQGRQFVSQGQCVVTSRQEQGLQEGQP
jgi:beta-aspartyl-dipeptidase (metallo-type)